jgi:hypothetical protein
MIDLRELFQIQEKLNERCGFRAEDVLLDEGEDR